MGTDAERYRCFHKKDQLLSNEIECNIIRFDEQNLLKHIKSYDIIIMHRVAYDNNVGIILNNIKMWNKILIFDIDDLVFEPDMIHWIDATTSMSEKELKLYEDGVNRYLKTLESCEYILTPTECLANFAKKRGKKAFIDRNILSKELLEISENAYLQRLHNNIVSERIILGYFSGTNTHNRDFIEITDALADILRKYENVELHIGGYLNIDIKLKEFKNQIKRIPFVPWKQLPYVISTVDINLAPLEVGNPYCESKSELKYLEAGILGIPTVASNVESYRYAITHGDNGLLASNTNEWVNNLELLIMNAQMRTRIGDNARVQILREYTPCANGMKLIDTLNGIRNKHQKKNRKRDETKMSREKMVINWIIPEPFEGGGGHTTIFRLIKYLVEFGHEVNLYIDTGGRFSKSDLKSFEKFISDNFFATGANIFKGYENIVESDAIIATSWSTAYTVINNTNSKKKFYFVQDFEPWFMPMSYDYILAEKTYKMGFSCITIGSFLTDLLIKNYGTDSNYINFSVDKDIYKPLKTNTSDRKKIIFYARAKTPRRAFELGIKSLKLVSDNKQDVDFILFGQNDLDKYDIPFPYINKGLVPTVSDLAEMYANADIGLVISLSNLSLIPLEMIACECAVVEIKGPNTEMVLTNEETAILAEPDPYSISNAIIRLLENEDLRKNLILNGCNLIRNSSWRSSAEKFEALLLKGILTGKVYDAVDISSNQEIKSSINHSEDIDKLSEEIISSIKLKNQNILELTNRLASLEHIVYENNTFIVKMKNSLPIRCYANLLHYINIIKGKV